ncbi:hypothetical protein NBRC116493_02740 [Aurantivibrio infirmus]
MEQLIKELFEKTPKCLSELKTSVSDVQLPRSWNSGPLFTTKLISCKCGNEELELHTAQRKASKGFFKKKEVTEYYPPVKVSCTKCNNSTTIFNPEVHGWNGETEESLGTPQEVELMPYSPGMGEVYVNYSYQGVENYEDLVEEGVKNPEDFFDTFTVLVKNSNTGGLVEVVSCECA